MIGLFDVPINKLSVIPIARPMVFSARRYIPEPTYKNYQPRYPSDPCFSLCNGTPPTIVHALDWHRCDWHGWGMSEMIQGGSTMHLEYASSRPEPDTLGLALFLSLFPIKRIRANNISCLACVWAVGGCCDAHRCACNTYWLDVLLFAAHGSSCV